MAGERAAVRGIHTFNRLPKTDDTLAPFEPVAPAMRGAIRRVDVANGEKLPATTATYSITCAPKAFARRCSPAASGCARTPNARNS